MPAMEIAAASRMFAALKTMPPRNALPRFPADACFRFVMNDHSPPPHEPAVRPLAMEKRTTPIT